MRDKQFVINSIKMDLYRVVTAVGDINKEVPLNSVKTFLKHADKDFDKIELDPRENSIRNDLRNLTNNLEVLANPHQRLRWTENIMTARCRL